MYKLFKNVRYEARESRHLITSYTLLYHSVKKKFYLYATYISSRTHFLLLQITN